MQIYYVKGISFGSGQNISSELEIEGDRTYICIKHTMHNAYSMQETHLKGLYKYHLMYVHPGGSKIASSSSTIQS